MSTPELSTELIRHILWQTQFEWEKGLGNWESILLQCALVSRTFLEISREIWGLMSRVSLRNDSETTRRFVDLLRSPLCSFRHPLRLTVSTVVTFGEVDQTTARSCIEAFETMSLRAESLHVDLTFSAFEQADIETIFRAIGSDVRQVTIEGDFNQLAPWMKELDKCSAMEELELCQRESPDYLPKLPFVFGERGPQAVKILHLAHGNRALWTVLLDWLETGGARLHALELNPYSLGPLVIRHLFSHSVCSQISALHLFRTTPPVKLDQLACLETLHMPIYLRTWSDDDDDRISGALETIASLQHRPSAWPRLELHFNLLRGYLSADWRDPDAEAFDRCLANLASTDTVRVFHFETNSIRLAELDEFTRGWLPELAKSTTVENAGLKFYGMVDWEMIKVESK